MACLTALQPFIKALLSIIWCSQLKLKGFCCGTAHSSSANSLFSSTEMFLIFFTLRPVSVAIRRVSEITYAAQSSNDPLFTPGFPVRCDFSMGMLSKQNQQICTSSITIKHTHSLAHSPNPSFNYSHKDFYLYLPSNSHFLIRSSPQHSQNQ